MAWIDIAKRDGATFYWVFRGSFYDAASAATTPAVWATQYVKASGELLEGRLLSLGGVSRAFPQTVGAMPESCSCSIVLSNADRALSKYVIGTTSSAASTEYAGDSFLNLRGSIYCGVIDTATGDIFEQRVTPTLVASGPVQVGQATITLSLAADDLAIFGERVVMLTPRMLKEASTPASGEGVDWSGQSVTFGGTTGSYSGAVASDHLGYIESNLDKPLPWLYGSSAIPVIPGTASGGLLMPTYLVGVTKEEPTITGFASWGLYVGSHAGPLRIYNAPSDVLLYKTKRTVTYDSNGSTVDVWLLLLGLNPAQVVEADFGSLGGFSTDVPDYRGTYNSIDLYVVPHSSAKLGMQSGYTPSPAGIVRQLIKDHGGGSGVVNATSFTRANAAMPAGDRFGGLLRTNAPIAGVCEYVCRAGGLNLWLGKGGALHMLPAAAWAPDDVVSAATDLPHLREVDVLGGYVEHVPRDPGERGAAAKLVAVEWSDVQRKFWEAEALIEFAPGASTLPIAGPAELEVPGDWLYPPRAEETLASLASVYGFVARRVSFVTHLWVGLEYELGQLFRFSHELGAPDTSSGYAYRLFRLEAVEIMPGENACRATFEDLGPAADTKPAVLDNIAGWVRYDPTGSTDAIRLTSASTTVTAIVGTPFATAQVGDHLWTFGATNALNRRSRKITAVGSSTQISVEYAYSANQANFTASAAGTAQVETAWIIMKTQGTKSPTNTTKLTACDEQSGNKFRDGSTAGFQCTGG